jgi:hypothetical protein
MSSVAGALPERIGAASPVPWTADWGWSPVLMRGEGGWTQDRFT